MYLGILPFLHGCAHGHLRRMVPDDITVMVQKHEPYCGGAYPNKSQLEGYVTELKNMDFLIKIGRTNPDSVPALKAVKTDT